MSHNWKKGDWSCQCGSHNFASRRECRACNMSKDNSAQAGEMVTDWDCSECDFNNYPSRSTCRNCGASSGKRAYVNKKPGDWLCPDTGCKELNFGYRDVCRACGTENTAPIKDWKCECGFKNFASRTKCRECSKAK